MEIKSSNYELEDLLRMLDKGDVFLTGGAGTGKTHLTRKVITYYRENQTGKVVVLGSTGTASSSMGGQTAHSFFYLGTSNNVKELIRNSRLFGRAVKSLRSLLTKVTLIVIDEISMLSSDLMECIGYRLRQTGYKGRIIFVGDFFQLPPVKIQQDMSKPLFAFESQFWTGRKIASKNLTVIKRTSNLEFASILEKVRLGETPVEVTNYLSKLLNNTQVMNSNPTFLFATNMKASNMNREKLRILDGEKFILHGVLTNAGNINARKLDTWRNSLPVVPLLSLKVGAPVLFTKNKRGEFVNGDQGIVEKIDSHTIYVKKGKFIIPVSRMLFELKESKYKDGDFKTVVLASLEQYPLKLGFAITIHKSQGMSIDNLVVDVGNRLQAGQFYVAISRARDPKKLLLKVGHYDPVNFFNREVRASSKVLEYYNQK